MDRAFPYLTARWDGKVFRLSPGQGEQEKAKEKTGLGRGEGKLRRKEEEEDRNRFWGWSTEKMQEGAACPEAQVCTRLCWPSSPALYAALSQCNSLARDGGRRGMVPRRVWKGLRGSSPVAPHRALLRGTGALCICARAQVSKGITPGDKVPEPSHRQCQQQLALLGHEQLLVNGVPQRKGNRLMPVPAFMALSVLSDSIVVGAVFPLLADPL